MPFTKVAGVGVGVGDGEGDGEAVGPATPPITPPDPPSMAKPATNTTMTAANASAALNGADMRGSFHRRRHAGRCR